MHDHKATMDKLIKEKADQMNDLVSSKKDMTSDTIKAIVNKIKQENANAQSRKIDPKVLKDRRAKSKAARKARRKNR